MVAFRLADDQVHIAHKGPAELPAPPDRMIFEIGSVSKLFTAILLWVLVEEGRLDPKAPLSEMSAELHDVPEAITPERLTAHISGLPRLHVPIWKAILTPLPADPYAAFSRDDLLAWLHTWSARGPRPHGRHVYSNLGIGLLGEAMAMAEGQPFTDLLDAKVLRPMGLAETTSHLNSDQVARFRQPRNIGGQPVPAWSFDALAAAGCLRSTAGDMASFARQVLHALATPQTVLDRAIGQSVLPVATLGRDGRRAQCSGWLRTQVERTGPFILHHDGATAGSTCAIYICPDRSQALGVVSNNGIEANLWASARLSWSNPIRCAHAQFAAA